MITAAQARSLVSSFSSMKILVFGDLMLDQFLYGRVDRISPEAPVPVVEVQKETYSLGGAGNVVINLLEMGVSVLPVGVVGSDSAGQRIVELLQQHNLQTNGVLLSTRSTTLKTRIIAHNQQVVRVDREERQFVEQEVQETMANRILENLHYVDAMIVSDYSKGTVTPFLLGKVLPAARDLGKLVCVDPKTRYFSSYSPVTVITPNQIEAGSILGYPILSEEDLAEAGRRILGMIDCKALLITRGEKGMALFADDQMTLIPTRAREVFDVTGAGDTVVSILCLALAAGADLLSAVHFANAAAGIVVGKLGTATVSPAELLTAFTT